MERLVLVAFGIAVVVAVLVVAALDRRWARDRRVELSRSLQQSETRAAFNELMAAQSLFTAEVLRYEAALQADALPNGTTRIDLYPSGTEAGNGRADLERIKTEPRRRLLAARRRWEDLRPRPVADAGPPRWVGFGEVRAWGFFLFGAERAFLRFEHATDPSIWATVEVRRRRLGMGLGVEVQRIGAVADHADPSLLLAMARLALDDTDLAVRPGFDVVRAARSARDRGPLHDLLVMMQKRSMTPALGNGSSRDDAADAKRLLDRVPSIEPVPHEIDAGDLDLRAESARPGTLRCAVAGPTVMLGIWRGIGTPQLRILGRSPHGEWSKPYQAPSPQSPEPVSGGESSFDVEMNSQV